MATGQVAVALASAVGHLRHHRRDDYMGHTHAHNPKVFGSPFRQVQNPVVAGHATSTVTMTERSSSGSVTRTCVPSGMVWEAAVIPPRVNTAPVQVRRMPGPGAYQEAVPEISGPASTSCGAGAGATGWAGGGRGRPACTAGAGLLAQADSEAATSDKAKAGAKRWRLGAASPLGVGAVIAMIVYGQDLFALSSLFAQNVREIAK